MNKIDLVEQYYFKTLKLLNNYYEGEEFCDAWDVSINNAITATYLKTNYAIKAKEYIHNVPSMFKNAKTYLASLFSAVFYNSSHKYDVAIGVYQAAINDLQHRVNQRLLTEKEWLLKEVHHWVKNNLHTETSLQESQTSQHRIYVIAHIDFEGKSESMGLGLMKGLNEAIDAYTRFEVDRATRLYIIFKPNTLNGPENILKSTEAKKKYA
jgi:hypothetical protein